MKFQAKDIEEYHKNSTLRHPYFDKTVKAYEDLKVHYYDDYPTDLIKKRRPGEGIKIGDYREEIAVSITNDILWGVFATCSKIPKSRDYAVRFDPKAVPDIINKEETPEQYMTLKFPVHTSLTNWTYSALLTQYGLDANAVVFTMHDITKPVAGNEYTKPYPTIYNADCIYDYKEGEYYILKSKEIHYFNEGKKGDQKEPGIVYYTVTTDTVQRFVQTTRAGDIAETHLYAHNLGRTPVHTLYGIIIEDNIQNKFCKSRLSPMVPRLKEIYREYSDVQASTVGHMFPTMWAYQQQQCKTCKGTGETLVESAGKDKKAVRVKCVKCDGKGRPPLGPYDVVMVTPGEAGEQQPVTPPMGYIQKETNIIELQDKRIADHRWYCLSSIHMQNSSSVPLNESGVSKEWDKDGENNTIHSIAEDLIRVDDSVAADIIDLRYGGLQDAAGNKRITPDELKAMRPTINVPQKFDLVGANQMLEDIKLLKDSNVDSTIQSAAEIELAEKMFATDPAIKDRVILKIKLDPLRGLTADDILAAGDDLSPLKRYIHFNIDQLIDELLEESEGFMKLDIKEKRELLETKATAEMEENNAAKQEKLLQQQELIQPLVNPKEPVMPVVE